MTGTYYYHGAWSQQAPPADVILAPLRAGHPRLMLDEARLAEIRALVARDPVAARVLGSVRAQAEALLREPAETYRIPDGRRLLSVSRSVKERVYALALVYRLEGGERYVARAWQELAAAAAFPDWNPSHFLDTAEMTNALAIGYDWLYDCWTPAQRATLREAIVTKGLEPGWTVYHQGADHNWSLRDNNWNQVCNAGLSLGALALADVEPDLAGRILHAALRSLPLAMGAYAPDGASTEGVTYWEYGSRYNILLLNALETALGTDFGLAEMDGFAASGGYQIHMSGAGRLSFDFGDCGLRATSSPQHFWLGRRYAQPVYSAYRYSALARPEAEGTSLDLLWFDDAAPAYDPSALPLDVHYRRAECASLRSNWGGDALIVGLQGGLNTYHGHRHQDLGSLIVDALGMRWIADGGVEPASYQGHRYHRQRWEYYRVRAEGHNTLVLNPGPGPDQVIGSLAPITRFTSTPARATAVIDLTAAYADHAQRVERTVEMIDRARLEVTDVIEAERPVEAWWFLHTPAEVHLAPDGRTALLSQGGKRLEVRLTEAPAGAAFTVRGAAPLPTTPNPPEQELDPALRVLAVHLPAVQTLRLAVRITPLGA